MSLQKRLQQDMKELGFYQGGIDGIWGPASEAAWKAICDAASQRNQAPVPLTIPTKSTGIAWSAKVTSQFVDKVVAICRQLGIEDPSDLMACMAWETGETFSPSVKNGAGSGACVDTETEILTETGWKRYDQVKIGDRVYSINYDKGEIMEMDEILHLTIKQSDHNYRMKSRSFDALSSHDHRWYLLQRFYCMTDNSPEVCVRTSEEIASLKNSHTYFIPHIRHDNVDLTKKRLSKHPLELFTLLGILASDGSVDKERKRLEVVGHIKSNWDECFTIEMCNDVLFGDTAPLANSTKSKDKNMLRWLYRKEQAEFLLQFFDWDYNQAIDQTRFIKKLNPSIFKEMGFLEAEALLKGYMLGDGHFTKSKNTVSFRNTEQAIIDDFMVTAVLVGENPRQVTDRRGGTYHTFPNGKRCQIKDIHTVWLRDSRYTSCAKHQLNVEKVDGEITVWCPTTKNQNWIARRNGTVYVTGNCGLIQFMPSTAKGLGTSTAELAKMTAEEQLDYVYKYFLPYKGRLKNLGDIYMAILYPRAVGKDDNYILFKDGTVAYRQNIGLDINRDVVITRGECLTKVRAKKERGLLPQFVRT